MLTGVSPGARKGSDCFFPCLKALFSFPPLELLHLVHAATRLAGESLGSMARGVRWSTVLASPPHQWQVLLSRLSIAARILRHLWVLPLLPSALVMRTCPVLPIGAWVRAVHG